jgi:uncharacterized membrane protein YeaQ/YmgE (transglycosylase-associated protein family)
LAWIVVGLIAGWLAKIISPGPERGGLLMTLIIGVIGALVGGALFNLFGRTGATGITPYSILVATVGAVVFLWVWKMLAARRLA